MVTIQISPDQAVAIGALYERACKLREGFSEKHKVTMSRLVKLRMRPVTIERLLDDIETVLSASEMRDDEARTLDAIRAHLRDARVPQRGEPAESVHRAIGAAREGWTELVAAGMPPSALPALASSEQFVTSAAAVIAAIRDHISARYPAVRAERWAASAAQLAGEACDQLAVEEAARQVEIACRWAANCFKHDERTGIITLTGPLVEPRAPGRLSIDHLECAIALDRVVYHPPELVGDLASGLSWLIRYPFAYHVVATRSLERVLGYIAALPMPLDDILAVVRSGDDAHVPLDRLAACTPGERVCIYIPSVVVRADCEQRSAVKNQLRLSFLRGLRWLRDRGVEIEAILAVGYTDGGRRLLHTYGFQLASDLEARLGGGSALLGGDRRLYRMTKAPAPHGRFGSMLHATAFAPCR